MKLYGWQDDSGKWKLSRFQKSDQPRPANTYDTQQEAVREAEKRGAVIEWQQ